ncbi:MgtC/SapB family protein [Bradyrhizobium ivorense]|uniref:MgtC/SapB family protein n=1 Tax=Bradyrhizobium ivorense TaxID=2511166 RepID=UPI001FCE48BD|nr:MgtC/SapB family protein [Bradyrhizobium ivorense]
MRHRPTPRDFANCSDQRFRGGRRNRNEQFHPHWLPAKGTETGYALHPTRTDIAIRIALTILASAIIGFDRGARGHAAGLRTTILVGLAASLSMIRATSFSASTERIRAHHGHGPDAAPAQYSDRRRLYWRHNPQER